MRKQLKNLFIPHEGNDFKPNVLERISIGVMLFLILLSFAAANLQSLLWVASDFLVSTILPAVIVDLTNEERTNNTLTALHHSVVLDEAATLKAEDMAKHEYFAHYSPDDVSPWHWFDQVSYDYLYAGENLAVYFTDSADVVDAWMKSPAHRENILSNNFTEIGVGTAKGEYKGYPTVFVVQLFGTPRAPSPALATAQPSDVTLEVTRSDTENTSTVPSEQVAPANFATIPESNLKKATTLDTNTSIPPQNAETLPLGSEGVNVAGEQTTTIPESVVVQSGLATTSRPGIPLASTDSGGPAKPETNFLQRMATQPSMWLEVVYGILALFVIVSLILSVVIEWRRQHPVQIAYAGGLLAVMAFLFYVHITLTTGATIL